MARSDKPPTDPKNESFLAPPETQIPPNAPAPQNPPGAFSNGHTSPNGSEENAESETAPPIFQPELRRIAGTMAVPFSFARPKETLYRLDRADAVATMKLWEETGGDDAPKERVTARVKNQPQVSETLVWLVDAEGACMVKAGLATRDRKSGVWTAIPYWATLQPYSRFLTTELPNSAAPAAPGVAAQA